MAVQLSRRLADTPEVRARVRAAAVPAFPLAIGAGALLALSFPRYGWAPLAWIALVPLLVALVAPAVRRTAARAFGLGLTTGAVYFAGTVYWTSGVMAQYGGMSTPLAIAIAGLLIAYLALFPACFAVILEAAIRRLGPGALLLAPAVWVTTEFLGRTVLFGGFPWALVGYSQATVLPIAQLAAVAGVYGLSALVVFVSAAIAFASVAGLRPSGWKALAIAGSLVAAVWSWGSARIESAALTRSGTALRVGLIQGNIAQDQKWAPALEDEILAKYVRLTNEAADRGARLVLWPESATPFFFEEHPKGLLIRRIARNRRIWMLIGSDQYEPGRPPRSYNAAFLIRPDGSTAGVYRKVHLVPFGEYVPAKRLLFFAAPLVEAVGDFSPGEAAVALPFDGHRLSTAICYEVVYPDLIRDGVERGSNLLTTITNDAWFGRSSAPYQHFEMAALRAIEEGRYMVRAANTGISGTVDPYGRVLMRSRLFEDRVLVGDVRLLAGETPYTRFGDLAAYGSTLVTALAVVVTVPARRRRA